MENQAAPVQKRKFLCLEDRFLQALYRESSEVSLQNVADQISISGNAAQSILHRINKEFPHYLRVNENADSKECWIAPNLSEKQNVDQFIMEGGFTRINEDEFLRYYEAELKKQKWQSRFQKLKSNIIQKKWQLSAVFLGGGGVLLATYLHFKKN